MEINKDLVGSDAAPAPAPAAEEKPAEAAEEKPADPPADAEKPSE